MSERRLRGLAVAAAVLAAAPSTGHHEEAATGEIEEVVVTGVRQRLALAGALQEKVRKTEVIGSEAIRASRAVSLTEALQDRPGIVVSNECSMCGYKRIQLNGLKAEHTTILNDDLITHTLVSGFYAVDAIPTTGVERIEVARGAGASMTTPEAIGGAVNIVTVDPVENALEVDLSRGETGFGQAGVLATLVGPADRARLVLIGQRDHRDQFDADGNGLSENPRLTNTSLIARGLWDPTAADSLSLRAARVSQELFGGPMIGAVVGGIGAAIASHSLGSAPRLFAADDVRGRFVGHPWEAAEWVASERREFSATWLRELAGGWNASAGWSHADHRQDSFYEGFDYAADNGMHYGTAQLGRLFADDHLVSIGGDFRHEALDSRSRAGQAANLDGDSGTVFVSDAYRYDVRAVFVQDSWTVNRRLTFDAALRLDWIRADFTDAAKPGREIDRRLLSPRVDVRYRHSDGLVSRIAAGRGYRAPLSFFETDHGLLDAALGFALDVDEPERSLSAAYALSFTGKALTWTLSVARTAVAHLATLDATPTGVPLLTQQGRRATVRAYDIAAGYRIRHGLTLNVTAAAYRHNAAFRSAFAVATIEDQTTVAIDWDIRRWEAIATWSWIGGRDLSDYGYAGFNDAGLTVPKRTRAPSFHWFDVRLSRDLSDRWAVYAGANNVFDATQAGDHESPLFYGADGAFDVAYIFGLLRGREIYAGIRFEF